MQLQTISPESKFPNEYIGVIFTQIDQHLKKLFKKYKGFPIFWNTVYRVRCCRALLGLNPYYVKTALLREVDEKCNWSSQDVGRRLMGVLQQLETAVSRAKLQHYYMPTVNLLSGLTWADTCELSPFGYVRCLLNSKAEMMSILTK